MRGVPGSVTLVAVLSLLFGVVGIPLSFGSLGIPESPAVEAEVRGAFANLRPQLEAGGLGREARDLERQALTLVREHAPAYDRHIYRWRVFDFVSQLAVSLAAAIGGLLTLRDHRQGPPILGWMLLSTLPLLAVMAARLSSLIPPATTGIWLTSALLALAHGLLARGLFKVRSA